MCSSQRKKNRPTWFKTLSWAKNIWSEKSENASCFWFQCFLLPLWTWKIIIDIVGLYIATSSLSLNWYNHDETGCCGSATSISFRIGNQVLYSGVLISLTLHGWHAFTTTGVRLKQKFSFSNFCPGRGLNPGPHSLMAVNVTTRLRRHPIYGAYGYAPWTRSTEVELRIVTTSKDWSNCLVDCLNMGA